MSSLSLANAHFSAQDFEATLWVVRTAGLLIAMLVLSAAIRHWRRLQEQSAERMFEQLDLVRTELLLLQERLERDTPVIPAAPRPVAIETRAAAPLPMQVPASPRGYEVAARLARSGATLEELVTSCGLSRHEAQLVQRLHGRQSSIPTVSNSLSADLARMARQSDTKASASATSKDKPASTAGRSTVAPAGKGKSSNAAAQRATELQRSRLSVVG